MKKTSPFVLAVVLAIQALPAFSQNYHYSYGNGRVVNKSQDGLSNHDSSYIGAGTLSQSAQGKSAGIGGLLPAVNMGAHVRTPGDNMYNGDGSERMYNGALIYEDQKQAILARKAAIYRQRAMKARRAQMQAQQQQRQTGFVYMPGSNGASASYANQSSQPLHFNSNGSATYGGDYTGNQKTRSF